MNVTLPALAGAEAQVWQLLFDLARAHPGGWALIGARMVMLHAAAHATARPTQTADADVVVDVRSTAPAAIAQWLRARDFVLDGLSPDHVGHRLRCDGVIVDLLAIDHAGGADLTTIPPARTLEVPGERRAIGRVVAAEVSLGDKSGIVPVPDWLGALLLKARAAVAFPGERRRHLQDLALLLGLPVGVSRYRDALEGHDRRHLQRAFALLDDAAWQAVASHGDVRSGRAAARLLIG